MKMLFASLLILVVAPLAAASTIDTSALSNDPIINIQSPGNSCATGGTNNQCLNGMPYSLSAILSGNIGLMTAQLGGAGSWRVINDTGATITSLVLYYSGMLASNASLTIGVSGWNATLNPFSNCTLITATSVVSTGSCSQGTANGPALPTQLIWSSGTRPGLAPGQIFNIQISSFAHAGQDVGCISGTANCQPKPPPPPVIPEPNTLALLGTGLLGIAATGRRYGGRKK